MKKLNILLISLFCIFATSCDDFLDIKPVGKVIPTTEQDFRDVLTNAYAKVPMDRNVSMLRSDELNLIFDTWSGDHGRFVNQFTWQDEAVGSADKQFPWQGFYTAILGANQVIIDGADATETNKDTYNQLVGEAYLLRAYMHFGLVNLFADVYSEANLEKSGIPLSTTIDIFKDYKKNTIGEVYTQILSDLNKGIELVDIEEQSKGFNYRFSKISAYGFAARLYLYMGDFDKALDYSKKALAINSSLEDLNTEGFILPVDFSSKENILALEQTYHSDYKHRFYISSKLENMYDKVNDLRFGIFFDGSAEGEYKCVLGKEQKNKVSMRTAEFYLNVAEAGAKSTTGSLTEAKQSLKDLLVKRFTPAYYTTQAAAIDAMPKEEFIVKVSEERMKELACQGFRWFDLRRNGKPELKKTFDSAEYTLVENDPKYVIPFPLEAVANNPNLKDN
jgi:tetratricopeptide (TPR) repeat protein